MSSSLETLSLSWGDPLAQAALTTGWIGPDRVIARAVLEKSNEVQPLVFFERVPSASARPASFGLWFQTVRGYSLTATLTP